MIWLDILRRFWPYLAGLALITGAWMWAHHSGYESGYAASEAHWQPLFATAERERDAANADARRKEASSKALSQTVEAEHAKTVASLNLRAADAERSNLSLVRELAARSRCGAVREASGSPAKPDATAQGDERLDRAAAGFTDLARRCESDAHQLAELQGWVRAQIVILREEH